MREGLCQRNLTLNMWVELRMGGRGRYLFYALGTTDTMVEPRLHLVVRLRPRGQWLRFWHMSQAFRNTSPCLT